MPEPMTESEYWVHLEFRLCREFAGLPDRRHQHFWCDGFVPSQYLVDGHVAKITGTVWICNGPQQSEWQFVLLLPRTYPSREDIEWASLLPPENTTRWMSFDENTREIEIDPAAAEPDLR